MRTAPRGFALRAISFIVSSLKLTWGGIHNTYLPRPCS